MLIRILRKMWIKVTQNLSNWNFLRANTYISLLVYSMHGIFLQNYVHVPYIFCLFEIQILEIETYPYN